MKIELWDGFDKKINSTKYPRTKASVTLDATLKQPTSIENPTFTISGNTYRYNYAYAFSHYYFITDVIYNTNGTTDLVCRLDALASNISAIQGYRGFIEYSSSSDRLNILDPRNNPTGNYNTAYTPVSFTNNPFHVGGVYILGVLNDSGYGANGPVCYYHMDATSMGLFQKTMFNHDFITNLVEEFSGSASSLVSCVWLPLDDTALSGIEGSGFVPVKVGSYEMSGSTIGYRVTGKALTGRRIRIPYVDTTINFPSSTIYGYNDYTYLDKAPYSTGLLYLPFVGCVPLDLDVFGRSRSVRISGEIDVLTGDLVWVISAKASVSGITDYVKVATYSGNIATNVPLSAASTDSFGTVSGTISTIGGIATAIIGAASAGTGAGVAAAVMGGVGATASGVMQTVKSFELHTMVNGSISSAVSAYLGLAPTIIIYTAEPTETILENFKTSQGLPFMAIDTVGNHSGYIKMRNASIQLSGAHADEVETVNNYLNSGFFNE